MILNLILALVGLVLIAGTWVAGTFLAWPLWVEIVTDRKSVV